jgi:hypothetical protein
MVYYKSVGSAVPTKLAAAQLAHAGWLVLSQPDINTQNWQRKRKFASFSKRETLKARFYLLTMQKRLSAIN